VNPLVTAGTEDGITTHTSLADTARVLTFYDRLWGIMPATQEFGFTHIDSKPLSLQLGFPLSQLDQEIL